MTARSQGYRQTAMLTTRPAVYVDGGRNGIEANRTTHIAESAVGAGGKLTGGIGMLEGSKLTAGDVMTRDPITVFADSSLRHVAKLLAQYHVSGLPVVDDAGHVVGIVTENDLLRWSDKPGEQQAWWLDMLAENFELSPDRLDAIQTKREMVSGVMKVDVDTVQAGSSLADIAKLLVAKSIKRVPVVQDGKLIGIVSRADLVRSLAHS